jgi:hypothetical protein
MEKPYPVGTFVWYDEGEYHGLGVIVEFGVHVAMINWIIPPRPPWIHYFRESHPDYDIALYWENISYICGPG